MRALWYQCSLLCLLFSFSVSNYAVTTTMKKFTWSATECAPKGYPMEIISGTFLYKGKDHGLYIPSGGTLTGGWGQPLSNHGSVHKPLPDRLNITFFSYAEKKFYRGEFSLPYDEMVKLFDKGVQDGQLVEGKVYPLYSKIMAGIAPGGVVSVWVAGKIKTEVYFGQAEEIKLEPSIAFDLPFESAKEADEYMEKGLSESVSTEQLRLIKEQGIPFNLWSRYRKRYHWFAKAKEGFVYDFTIKYVNGESDKAHFPFVDSQDQLRLLPVPRYLLFRTDKYIYDVQLAPLEIVAAFERLDRHKNLSEEQRRIAVELDLRYPRSNSRVRVFNARESIVLKKVIFTDW